MNRIIIKHDEAPDQVEVGTLPAGTLVWWRYKPQDERKLFVVLNYKGNHDGIVAVSVEDGGWLQGHTLVNPIGKGTVLEVVAQ